MNENMVQIEKVCKEYRLGAIGGTTLKEEIQRFHAKIRGKEDPTLKIGQKQHIKNEKFMALTDVSFEVKKGEALGIIGHNGAGKSTLLKLLSRVTSPTKGSIGLNGRITSMLEVGTGFHPELTGRENIYMNGAILGMTKAEIDLKMENIIDFSECRQFIDTPVKRYSSGMYVKLAFSVAAHLDSEILIMDEVLAVGDMAFQQKCIQKMKDVAEKEGRTILYVSHNMNTIRQLCDRCVVLSKGTVVFDGLPEDAIAIYMGSRMVSDTHLNTKDEVRDAEFRNDRVWMDSIEFLNCKSSQFAFGDTLIFKLGYRIKQRIEKLHIRIVIKSLDGTPVTMATTSSPLLAEDMEWNSATLQLRLGSIAPGQYSMSFVAYQVDEFGSQIHLDGLKDIYCFSIQAKEKLANNMQWKSKYWGYFIAENLELIEQEIENG